MISSIGIQHSLNLRCLSILAVWLCVHCVHCWSWFEAKDQCQSIGQPLGSPPHTNNSLWSFYYTRRSHWMAALGCASSLNGKTYNLSMQIPSAGLCQELCMEKLINITVFIVKNKTCICSTDYPVDLHPNISQCKFDCINDMNSIHSYKNNSCKETTGPKAFSVFLSQSIREEDGAPLNATSVPVYCNITMSSTNDQLQNCKIVCLEKGKNFQKKRFESFCTNIKLLQKGINSATTTQHSEKNPLVFRRQTYISHDRVNHDRKNATFSDFEKTNIILSCQLCLNGGCNFKDCNEKTNSIVCSNGFLEYNLTSVSTPTKTDKRLLKTTATAANYSKLLALSSLLSTTVIQKPNATTHTSGSFSQEQTSTQSFDEVTKESETMKSYGIMATSLLICIILIGVFIFIIRRKQTVIKRQGPITLKDSTERTSNRKEKKRSGGVSVANSPKLCLYSFANNSKLEEQTQYNQENEVLYHHLRESVPTNNVNDDTYMVAGYKTSDDDNVYFGRMEDPYDHLRGTDRTRHEDDTYDHAPNVGEPT